MREITLLGRRYLRHRTKGTRLSLLKSPVVSRAEAYAVNSMDIIKTKNDNLRQFHAIMVVQSSLDASSWSWYVCMFVCMFVCLWFFVPLGNFSLSLACHTYCDTGHLFTCRMVMFFRKLTIHLKIIYMQDNAVFRPFTVAWRGYTFFWVSGLYYRQALWSNWHVSLSLLYYSMTLTLNKKGS